MLLHPVMQSFWISRVKHIGNSGLMDHLHTTS
jgi:hypothetical protein